MSFAEDEGYYDPEMVPLDTQWQRGYHTTKEGEELCLTEMTDAHLENTIKYFEDIYSVEPLKKELISRKKWKTK